MHGGGLNRGSLHLGEILTYFFFLYNVDSFSEKLEEGFLFENIFPFLTLSICIYFSRYFLHAAIQNFRVWFIKATMNPLPIFKLLYQ